MKNQLSLNIQTPCSKNFNHFKPTSKGGFCNACNKEVIDFTKMNSEDIITYFKTKSDKNTCGRFTSNQLKTYESTTKHLSKFSFVRGIGLACLTLFSFGIIHAQDSENKTKKSENNTTKIMINDNEKTIVVKGNVSEASIPMPSVNVILDGTSIGTMTDINGNFVFPEKLKKGDVLVFSILGMETQKVTITDEASASNVVLEIDMDMTEIVLMGDVAVKKVYSSKSNK
jgi:hypothetical protein